MASLGFQALFMNNFNCRKLMEVKEWTDDDWDDKEKVLQMLSDTGLVCTKDQQFQRHALCRRPDDTIMKSLKEKQLRVWDNDWVIAVVFLENHWRAKMIQVQPTESDGQGKLRVYSLEPGTQSDVDAENDKFDECFAKIAAHQSFMAEDMHEVAVNFATGIPGSLFDDPVNDIEIPARGDGKSCFIYALRDLCIAFKFLGRRFDEDLVATMRLGLFDVMMNPAKWRNENGPRPVIRMLSVQQPWADLIMSGEKKIENRSWKLYYTAKNQWIALQSCKPKRKEEQTERTGCILGMCFCECATQIEGGNFLFSRSQVWSNSSHFARGKLP